MIQLVKSEAVLVKGSSIVNYYEKKGLCFREFQSSKVEKGKVYCQLIVHDMVVPFSYLLI
jgi:hypothetical protein